MSFAACNISNPKNVELSDRSSFKNADNSYNTKPLQKHQYGRYSYKKDDYPAQSIKQQLFTNTIKQPEVSTLSFNVKNIKKDPNQDYTFSNQNSKIVSEKESYLRYSSLSCNIKKQSSENENMGPDISTITLLKNENRKLRSENIYLRNLLLKKQSNASQERNQISFNILEQIKSQKLNRENEHKIKEYERQKALCYQIIDNLEKRIEGLLEQIQTLELTVKRISKDTRDVEILTDKYERLRKQFHDLEKCVRQDNEEWELHKVIWINEKQYYKEIIRKLECQVKLRL